MGGFTERFHSSSEVHWAFSPSVVPYIAVPFTERLHREVSSSGFIERV